MANPIPSLEVVRDLYSYDPVNGRVTNKRNISSRARIGQEAGARDNGYRKIQINGSQYGAHRIAWYLYYGAWPDKFIDHINGDRSDNRIENLRLASVTENQINSRARPSASGIKGARRVGNRYRSQCYHEHLGYFDTPEQAHEAYMARARELFGEFARSA